MIILIHKALLLFHCFNFFFPSGHIHQSGIIASKFGNKSVAFDTYTKFLFLVRAV